MRVPRLYVPFVWVLDWAGVSAFAAACAAFWVDVAGVFADFNSKVADVAVALDEFTVGEYRDVWVACAIHHFWAFDAYAAVKGWESFIQRCHVAADALAFLEHVDFEALLRKVQSGVYAGDSSADDECFVCYWNLYGLQGLH